MDSQRIDIEPHQEQQSPQDQSSPSLSSSFTQQRIYLVTDGLKYKHTKRVYNTLFNQFLKEGAHTSDLPCVVTDSVNLRSQ